MLIHAIQLIRDEKVETVETHRKLQSDFKAPATIGTSTPYAGSEMSEVSEISELLDRSSTSMEEVSKSLNQVVEAHQPTVSASSHLLDYEFLFYNILSNRSF